MEYKIYRCENPDALLEAIEHASPVVGIIVHFRTENERGGVVSVAISRAVSHADGTIEFEGKTGAKGADVIGDYSLDQQRGTLAINSIPPLCA